MTFVWAVVIFVAVLVSLSALLIVAERFLVNYGVCTVDINAGERRLDVEGGQSLLSGLIGEKIFIPSACGGRGLCGYCKVVVLSGGGPVLPTETPLLTRAEIRSGVRLACQVKIRQDIEVRLSEELLNVEQFAARVASVRYLTHDIKEIRFTLHDPRGMSHRPGQYVQIQAPSSQGPVFRAYSISSPACQRGDIELNVRRVPDGIGSTYLHSLRQGDPVMFTGPYGEFRLSEDPETEIICVGGGSGMAPMKNIIHTLYERWPDRSCWLFFGCRTTNDVFYLDEFKRLAAEHPNFHVVYALSNPGENDAAWGGETGFIHLSVDRHLDAGVKRQAFLCGPPLMIEAVMAVLDDKQVAPADVFYDKF